MRFIKILFIFIAILAVCAVTYAAEHASPGFILSKSRVVTSGGEAVSSKFMVDNVVVGSPIGGKAESSSFSISSTETIVLLDPPVTNFKAVPINGDDPLTVNFSNHTTGRVIGNYWEFGDGGTSTAKDPIHTFFANGAEMDYQADQLPRESTSGWSINQYSGVPMIEVIEGGIYRCKSDLISGGVNYLREIDFRGDSEYVIETRFKLGDFNAAVTYGAMSLKVSDDTYYWRLDFAPQYIAIVRAATSVSTYYMNTQSAYHDYKIVANNGIVKVYVDGSEKISANMTSTVGSHDQEISFGSMLRFGGPPPGTYYAEGYWDHIKTYPSVSENLPEGKHYTVKLRTTGTGGVSSEIKTDYIHVATVPLPPVADFSADPLSGDRPLNVQFTNASSGVIDDYLWEFGDGATGILENPSHTYLIAGSYTVKLTATGPGGAHSTTKTDYIGVTVPPPAISGIVPGEGVIGENVRITGSNFNLLQGAGYVKFSNNKQAPIIAWSDAAIDCVISAGAISGSVVVVTAGGTSNAALFSVILPVSIATTSLPQAQVGENYEEYVNAVDGTQPYVWSIQSGSLPADLTLEAATGKIAGSPAADGTSNVVIKVADAALRIDTRSFSLIVNSGISDLELLDKTQAESALYFYNEALSNGLVKDGNHKSFSSIAATGFGLASLCISAERYNTSPYWTVTPTQAESRVNQILDTCLIIQNAQIPAGNEYGIAGFLFHFINASGTRQGDSEVSTVDTAILLAGAIVAGEYFGGDVKVKVDQFYNNIDWNYFINSGNDQFSHGWKPEVGVFTTTWDRPSDETLLISLLAIGSDPDNVDFIKTLFSWPRTTRNYAGYSVVNSYFGSLFTYFFAHCFYDFESMAYDNPSVIGSSVAPIKWWDNSVSATYAARQFCIDQSSNYSSYGPDSWGITPCEYPNGGYGGSLGAAPCEYNNGTPYHDGTIAPYGAISSMPLTRTSDTEVLGDNLAFRALKHYYDTYKDDLWGVYGPKDAFDHLNRFTAYYLGIDVGPQVLMIENYRSGLIWQKFMANSAVQAMVNKVFTDSEPQTPDIYVDVANAGDPNEDGSQAHPYGMIQEGIDSAVSGDLIEVAAGTYYEVVNLNKSGITLQGESQGAIIDGGGNSWTVYCYDISGQETVLKGFTITNGYQGVVCASTATAIRIEGNDIRNNMTNQSGYGIRLIDDSVSTIINNSIHTCGKGIYGEGANFSVTISGNNIYDCRASYGGGIYLMGGAAVITDNTITGCWDGAIHVSDYGNATVMRNIVRNNGSWAKSAGINIQRSTAILRNNVIAGNEVYGADGGGAGLRAYDSTLYMYNNIFDMNRGDSSAAHGVAMQATSDTNLDARNNIFYRNSLGMETVYYAGAGTQLFDYNLFWENNTSVDMTGITPGDHIIDNRDPDFVNTADYLLNAESPCINAGDPAAGFNDPDGTINDIGIHGGPEQ